MTSESESRGRGPAYLFTGLLPVFDETFDHMPRQLQVMVTVWEDGTAELAIRRSSHETWGPPTKLTSHME